MGEGEDKGVYYDWVGINRERELREGKGSSVREAAAPWGAAYPIVVLSLFINSYGSSSSIVGLIILGVYL